MKKKFLIFLAVVLVAGALTLFTVNYRDYSKHTFTFLDGGFTWDMTMADARAYIEQNQVQTWRDIVTDGNTVQDGFYHFDFDSEGGLYRVRINMGGDSTIIHTLQDWFGECDKVTTTQYGWSYYYWYGMMDGKKTEAYFYMPSGTGWLWFNLEE